MRLHELGLRIGDLPSGPLNVITDVPGVRLGHARGAVGGITVVQPWPERPRRCYAGRWSLDGGDETTGLNMLEDFGALSTPICLAPAPAVGRVYDGFLDYGFAIDDGLGEDQGWPPAIVGVEGLPAPAVSLHAALGAEQVAVALSSLTEGAFVEGQVGVGLSLAAFGVRAGVGSASRAAEGRIVGVVVAANGGEMARLSVDGVPVGRWLAPPSPLPQSRRRSAAAVIVTDAPLVPGQLDRLAQRAAFGFVRVGLLDENTSSATVLALSTTGLDDATPGLLPGTVSVRSASEEQLSTLFRAGADACEEAVLNALVAAHNQRSGDDTPGLAVDAFRDTARLDPR